MKIGKSQPIGSVHSGGRDGGVAAVVLNGLRRRKAVWPLLGTSLVSSVFAVTVPVYGMQVFDALVARTAPFGTFLLLAGVCIVVLADIVVRTVRARLLTGLGHRCISDVGIAAMARIAELPLDRAETLGAAPLLSRTGRRNAVVDLFSGPVVAAALDLPFVPIVLGVTALVDPFAALISLVAVAAYTAILAMSVPVMRARISASDRTDALLQSRLVETVVNRQTVQRNQAEGRWLQEVRRATGMAVRDRFTMRRLESVVGTFAGAMALGAMTTAFGLGIWQLGNGETTVGAVIAALFLCGRALAPFLRLCRSLRQASAMIDSLGDVDEILTDDEGQRPITEPLQPLGSCPEIALKRVSYRHDTARVPAVSAVDLAIPYGQFVAVSGADGAGKSTLLKLMAGLYRPQAGTVMLGGSDVERLDRDTVGAALAYVAHPASVFETSVRDNLLLSRPDAQPGDIARACREAGLGDDAVSALPRDDAARAALLMSPGFRQRIALARAWIRTDAPLVLLDEPAAYLDPAGEEALLAKLRCLRGHATIVMTTRWPGHMRLADRVVHLERGTVVHDGVPDSIVPLIDAAEAA